MTSRGCKGTSFFSHLSPQALLDEEEVIQEIFLGI
jgi:hypothetical protein